MSTSIVAGIDSSTQSCKVTVRDAETGAVLRQGRAPHPDGTEVDPEHWWTALAAAVADAGGLSDVAAVAVGGQQHGLVALDADGRVVRPALLWNDLRSADAAAAMTDALGPAVWVERAGFLPVASFTGPKLRWLRDHEPEAADRVAAVALPHDWLTWRLRGYGPAGESSLGPVLDELTTDGSDASGTAYWDPSRRQYDAELFASAFDATFRVAGSPADASSGIRAHASTGHPAVVLPRVVDPDQPIGALQVDVPLPLGDPLPQGLVVGAGAGDNAAAALGLGLRAGDIAISLGTSGTVFGVTDTALRDDSGTVAGFADATGARLPIVTTLNAARVLDLTAELLGVGHAELGTLALGAPAGADGLVLVPYFVGERTPNRPGATASLHGMTPTTTTRTHIARAGIEGMLCGLADGLTAMEAAGVVVSRLLLIGGAAQNDAVRTSASQVFGRDVFVPEPTEYVAAGAARQAVWALTGNLPEWPVSGTTVPADPVPSILDQYREHAHADRP